MKFWFLWGFDAVVALVVVYFFVWGLIDGSVSGFNIGLWLTLLAIVAGVMVGGYLLRGAGHPVLATLVLLILGIPGFLYGLFVLLMLVMKPRWN